MSANELILLLAVLGSLVGLWWIFCAGRRSDLDTIAAISDRRRGRNGGAP